MLTTAFVVAAVGVGQSAREDARGRCVESRPAFPRRVVAIDVTWRLVPPGYDCVYLDGSERMPLTMPPCPRGHYRPTGGERCAPGDESDWHSRRGRPWNAYASAYREGWVEGCRDVVRLVHERERGRFAAGVCRPPGDAREARGLPGVPPADPDTGGYEHGFLDGCAGAFTRSRTRLARAGHSHYSKLCPAIVRPRGDNRRRAPPPAPDDDPAHLLPRFSGDPPPPRPGPAHPHGSAVVPRRTVGEQAGL